MYFFYKTIRNSMIRVEECPRSTLYRRFHDGMLLRNYHDTDRWSDAFPPILDDRGHARCSGNRRIDLLVEQERAYGSNTRTSRRTPPYLQNALRVLCKHQTPNIDALARELEVKTTTAWSYAYKVVEIWPRAHEEASRLVHPEIMDAVEACTTPYGSLKDVYQCIHMELGAAREVPDLFAHIRLARACTEARKKYEKE
jgi:hypothetical protein